MSSEEGYNDELPSQRDEIAAETAARESSHTALAVALTQNFARDWTWGAFSEQQYNFYFQPTPQDFGIRGEWFAEFFYSSLAPIAVSIISAAIIKGMGRNVPHAEILATLLGTMAAIVPWNAGQNLGMQIGRNNGWTQENSSYFAGIFTGIFEGLTQYAVIELTRKFANPEEYRRFRENPKEYLATLFAPRAIFQVIKDLGFASTLGAIPGAMWQVTYTACTQVKVHAAATGLIVAEIVGLCNFMVAKADAKRKDFWRYVKSCSFFGSEDEEDDEAATNNMLSATSAARPETSYLDI